MINRLTKSLLAVSFATLLGSVIAIPHTKAASPVCALKDGLQMFVDARGSNQKLELDARKGLLFIIADCTKEETEAAIDTLAQIDVREPDLASAKQLLSDNLKLEYGYIDEQKVRINDVGIGGTRDLARTIKEWRLNTHLPQTGNVNNFVLLKKNQELLIIAQTRSRQIEQTLKNLRLVDQDEVKKHLSEANEYLSAAGTATQSAKESLQHLDNPDSTARSLQNSFNSLSGAYASFLDVSNAVKKILPF